MYTTQYYSKMNSHFHTHVNTHFCSCGRTHISAHTHVHMYPVVLSMTPKAAPPPTAIPVDGVAKRTRSRVALANWESDPDAAQDKDLVRRLDFLRNSDDPWERSLVPEVERDAIQQSAKRPKKAAAF
jgi:predicted glycoside hydrolase/deacetylase ChbG (UPF0249 family)